MLINFSDLFLGGLSKFAKLARSVTRSRSALASQLSNQVVKEPGKQSNLTQVKQKLFKKQFFIILFNCFSSADFVYKSHKTIFKHCGISNVILERQTKDSSVQTVLFT